MKLKKTMATLLMTSLTMSCVPMASTMVYASPNNNSSYYVNYATVQDSSTKDIHEMLSQEDIKSILPFLEAIDKMPNDLLEKGDSKEINNFFTKCGFATHVYNPEKGETFKVKRSNAWRCGLAIGQLIVTVGLPVSQVAKIKNYIAALGGIKEAALLLTGATTASEKAQGILAALGQILLTATGTDIQEYCFD